MKNIRGRRLHLVALTCAAALAAAANLPADETPQDDPLIGFSTLLGGLESESDVRVAVAPDGTVWVAGISSSPDYLPGLPLDEGARGRGHLRVTRLDPDTHQVLSSLRIPGTGTPTDLRIDADGAALVVGMVSGSLEFVPTTGIDSPPPMSGDRRSDRDAYLLKIAADGSGVAWSAILGGSGDEFDPSLAIAADGDPVVCIATTSDDFPLAAPLQAARGGFYDIGLVRVQADGSAIVHSTYLGGPGSDFPKGIAIDADGDCVLAVATDDATFVSALRLVGGDPEGTREGVLVEIAADGSFVQRSALLGATEPWHLAFDGSGNLFVGGVTEDPEFPADAAPHGAVHGDEHDAFLLRLDADWEVDAAAIYGGTGWERPMGIATGADGLVWMFGDTRVKDLPMPASTRPFVGGYTDSFAAAFEADDLSLRCATYYGGMDWQGAGGCAADAGGGLWIAGNAGVADIPYVDPILQRAPTTQAFDHYLARLLPGDPAGCPGAPGDLRAEALDDGTARLTWLDASTNETGFAIFRRDVDPLSAYPGTDVGFRRIAVVHDASEWVDDTIIEGVAYEWSVQAINGSGGSAPSGIASLSLANSIHLIMKDGSQSRSGTVHLRGRISGGGSGSSVLDPREHGFRVEFDGGVGSGGLRQVAPGDDGWRDTPGGLVYRGKDFRFRWQISTGRFDVVLRRVGHLVQGNDGDRNLRVAFGCRAAVRRTDWRHAPGGNARLR